MGKILDAINNYRFGYDDLHSDKMDGTRLQSIKKWEKKHAMQQGKGFDSYKILDQIENINNARIHKNTGQRQD